MTLEQENTNLILFFPSFIDSRLIFFRVFPLWVVPAFWEEVFKDLYFSLMNAGRLDEVYRAESVWFFHLFQFKRRHCLTNQGKTWAASPSRCGVCSENSAGWPLTAPPTAALPPSSHSSLFYPSSGPPSRPLSFGSSLASWMRSSVTSDASKENEASGAAEDWEGEQSGKSCWIFQERWVTSGPLFSRRSNSSRSTERLELFKDQVLKGEFLPLEFLLLEFMFPSFILSCQQLQSSPHHHTSTAMSDYKSVRAWNSPMDPCLSLYDCWIMTFDLNLFPRLHDLLDEDSLRLLVPLKILLCSKFSPYVWVGWAGEEFDDDDDGPSSLSFNPKENKAEDKLFPNIWNDELGVRTVTCSWFKVQCCSACSRCTAGNSANSSGPRQHGGYAHWLPGRKGIKSALRLRV